MSDYIIHNGTLMSEELYHYGVKGMRWGVRKATKTLSSNSSTEKEKARAAAKLGKMRERGSKELSNLQSKAPKLEKKVDKMVQKNDVKSAKLRDKQAKLKKKIGGRFTSVDKAQKLMVEANQLDIKASQLEAKSNKAKMMLSQNKNMQKQFQKEISKIDAALVTNGQDYIEKYLKYYSTEDAIRMLGIEE